ncbi:MAG: Rieske (2Fe-2S) protein [Planctomycetes bacterium]|nr:Rieske (2Fe-2S) protein [Planctomycetota bacterium]
MRLAANPARKGRCNEGQVVTESRAAGGTSARRGVLATILMLAGVIAGYGLGIVHFFQFLVPAGRRKKSRMFVGTLDQFPVGSGVSVKDPSGREITVVRVSDDAEHPERGFKALSSKCPHLGCQVHWEEANDRFFCPCHNGVFNRDGVATAGPPAAEGKNLPEYEVRVDKTNGWVFVMVTREARYGV